MKALDLVVWQVYDLQEGKWSRSSQGDTPDVGDIEELIFTEGMLPF